MTIAAILLSTLFAQQAEAKRNAAISEQASERELLTDEYKFIRIELDSACVDWASPTYLGKRMRIFYGSRYADSIVFVTSARSNLKNIANDTIHLPGPFKATANTGIYPVVVKESDNYPLIGYAPETPFEYTIFENQIDTLPVPNNLHTYFNGGNKIIKIISDGRNSLKAFYLDKRFDKGVIMSISSNDNGKTWGYPVKSLSSNTESFVHATMSQTRNGTIYILLVNSDGKAFVSTSGNNGHTWTYPKELSRKMDGDGHSMTIHRSGAFIIYRRIAAEAGNNFENGDYILWTSSVKELENGASQGTYKRIIKNEAAEKNEVRSISLSHLMNNRYLMTVIFRSNGKCVAECYKFGGNFYL